MAECSLDWSIARGEIWKNTNCRKKPEKSLKLEVKRRGRKPRADK